MDKLKEMIPQNPIDGELKNELQQIITSVVGTFTTTYAKQFVLALVAKKEEEAEEAANPPEKSHLQSRPRDQGPKEDRKSGYLTKEGAVRKNWKKRYFVVRHDWTVDYFADEKTFTKGGKPKGTMSLAGYRVVEDVGASVLAKLKALAAQLGQDESSLPEPKKYPDHCFEISHSRRRSFFIACASEEEKKEWVEMFKSVCWHVDGFQNKDPLHRIAFNESVWATRWSLDQWGWWSSEGSEIQVLSDVISDEIERKTLGKITSRITGSWAVRNAARNQALKVIDGMVSAAVTPAWKTIDASITKIRAEVEPKLSAVAEAIAKAKQELIDRIKSVVMDTINPFLEQYVTPYVKKIYDFCVQPVLDGFNVVTKSLENKLVEWTATADESEPSKGFRDLDRWAWYQWNWDARRKLDVLYDFLWDLRTFFTDIWPWGLIWKGYEFIDKMSDDGVYSFQLKLKQLLDKGELKGKEAIEKARLSTLKKAGKDVAKFVAELVKEILHTIIYPPLEGVALKAVKPLLSPLEEQIPDPVKQFVDITKMFQKLLNGIVNGSINTVIKAPAGAQ